jgi:putative transposase
MRERAMPRLPRLFVAGQVNHVIQRGNNRAAIFFEDVDRRPYLEWLGEAMAAQGCALHAYVLMTNHVHLLVTAARADALPKALQSLGRRYVGHVNRRYGRTGTLWEGRYRSTIVDGESYALACYRYIEANPLRARMVADAADHPWSSYHRNALGRTDPLITEHAIYTALGATTAERQQAYRALFAQPLAEQAIGTIRDATNQGWVAGSERFREQIAAAIAGRRVTPPRRGRPPKAEGDDADAETPSQPRLL